jgi:uncharacterized membrane protein HdeD (DUF308 family)
MATSAKITPDPLLRSDLTSRNMHKILQENWWVITLRGIIGILFGLVALLLPGVTILSLVLIFAAYMLVDGAFSLAGALRALNKNKPWGWILLNGIISIIAAILAVLWPAITAVVFVLLVAAWSIIAGAMQLVAGYRTNQRARGRGWLIFSGIVSILFGALLVLSPILGAIVLTWWIGAYVLVWSVLLLVIAFSVRSKTAGQGNGVETPASTAAR